MQDLENDMDGLFQRAAENYPLKGGKGDWEIVSKKLAGNAANVAAGTKTATRKRNYFFALLSLLFIFCGSLIIYFLSQNNSPEVSNKTVLSKNQNKSPAPAPNNGMPTHEVTPLNNRGDILKKNVVGKSGQPRTNKISRIVKRPGTQNLYARSAGESTKEPDTANGSEQNSLNSNFSPAMKTATTNEIEDENKKAPEDDVETEPKKFTGVGEIAPALKDSVANKKSDKNLNKKSSFYLGVVAGPDYSRVKEKSFGSSGFTAGLLVGYKVKPHFSIESGVSWNRKYFNSEGKDFHMEKMGGSMPTGMVIDNLESQTALVEIPLNVKYDFLANKNSAVFLAAGMSAYIMTKEKNMYTVTYNGSQQKMQGIYNKTDYGFPAVASFSLGFEHHISTSLKIRIEPYLKIPLQGMGVGSLPVTSTGLHLAITSLLK